MSTLDASFSPLDNAQARAAEYLAGSQTTPELVQKLVRELTQELAGGADQPCFDILPAPEDCAADEVCFNVKPLTIWAAKQLLAQQKDLDPPGESDTLCKDGVPAWLVHWDGEQYACRQLTDKEVVHFHFLAELEAPISREALAKAYDFSPKPGSAAYYRPPAE